MSLLSPRSIAVVGASQDEKKVGHMILKNLVEQGFSGEIYPINPKAPEILGRRAYPSLTAIGATVDLAVIVTPAATVNALVEECGRQKVPSVVVISAGFGEAGEEGRTREHELERIARAAGIALVGPNCLGVMRPSRKMNASFGNILPPAGSVALLSQSGALGQAFVDAASSIGLGLSLFVSMGNKAVMDECDFLRICGEDPETRVIGLYLESLKDGRKFLSLARKIVAKKPIVLLKAGTTERGRTAVSSHTGALAGSDAAVDAVCRQGGIRRAQTGEEFLDLLRTLSAQPPLASSAIGIVTNAGGPGVLATDAAEKEGLLLRRLAPEREAKLAALLPPTASVKNPVDVLGDALADRFEAALKSVAEEEEISGTLVIVTPQVMTPSRAIAETIVAAKRARPERSIVTAFMGGNSVRDAVELLTSNGIPNFPTPETAVRMLAALRPPALDRMSRTLPPVDATRAAKAQAIVKNAGKGMMDEAAATALLELYGLPLPKADVASSPDRAVEIAKQIGFPVTAKVSSKEILHKTEVGGVRLRLASEEAVRKAYDEILISVKERAPQAAVQGILIQQCMPPGSEFIVGALRDPSVGHLVMVGLGGIYTELFRDTSFRVAPIGEDEAADMLQSLKSWKLLLGMRGKPPLARKPLAQMVSTVSQLVTECPQIKEIDFNPVLVSEKQLTILDAKVVVD